MTRDIHAAATRFSWRRAAALFVILASVYLITYTGKIISGDEVQYVDAAGSVSRSGVPLTAISLWNNPPLWFVEGELPIRATIGDPFIIYTAAVLHGLAERIAGVGLVHTVWLYNVLMTPLVAVLTYALALRLGASQRAALMSAFAFGLLTCAWTYTQTFFREPPMMALMLAATLAFLHVPRASTRFRAVIALAVGVVALVLAYFTKDALLFMLFGLVLLVLPSRLWASSTFRRLVLAALALMLLICFALIYTPVLTWVRDALPGGYIYSPAFPVLPETTRIALHSYLLSVGGSIWGTSPVLLLALPGAWLLWRRQPDYVAAVLIMTLGLAICYAILRGEGPNSGNWFGGNVWPMRFLLPVLPFLAALTAPVWDAARGRWVWAGIAALCVYSLWWQVSAVVFDWGAYDTANFEHAFGLTYWLPGMNLLAHLRPLVLMRAVGVAPLDFAWARADILPYALTFVLPLVLAALALWRRRAAPLLIPAVLLMVGFTYGGLRLLHDRDPFYSADRDDWHAMVDVIRETVPPDGVVVVNSPDSTYFWLNYARIGPRWMVGLFYPPGDRYSFEQPLELESPDAALEIRQESADIIEVLATQRSTLWVFMDSSLYHPWSRRPLERYMAERYYPIGERFVSAGARLLAFDTTPAPAWDAPAVPDVAETHAFTDPETGDTLILDGYTLPRGGALDSGATLPLTLVWRAESTPVRDYTVAVFVISEADPYIRTQGADSWPGGTFKPTTLLLPDTPVWDHRGIAIPDGWPAGTYFIGIKVYFNDDGRIVELTPDGVTREGMAALGAPVQIEE